MGFKDLQLFVTVELVMAWGPLSLFKIHCATNRKYQDVTAEITIMKYIKMKSKYFHFRFSFGSYCICASLTPNPTPLNFHFFLLNTVPITSFAATAH